MSEGEAPVEVTAGDEKSIKAGDGDGAKVGASAENVAATANTTGTTETKTGPMKPQKASGNDFFLCIGLLLIFMVVCAVGAILLYILVLSGSKILGSGRIHELGVGVVNKEQ